MRFLSVHSSPFVKNFLRKNKSLLIMVHLTTVVNLVCVISLLPVCFSERHLCVYEK
jgi:hypothetical protein